MYVDMCVYIHIYTVNYSLYSRAHLGAPLGVLKAEIFFCSIKFEIYPYEGEKVFFTRFGTWAIDSDHAKNEKKSCRRQVPIPDHGFRTMEAGRRRWFFGVG